METTPQLQRDALTETYNDVKNLINKMVWDFYKKYGGEFEEWKAQANLSFIQTYNSYKKNKGQFSTWLCFCIWKNLLSYLITLHKQNLKTITTEENGNIVENLEDKRGYKKKHFFSSLELFDEIGNDTKTLVYLIWNLPHNLPVSNGNHPCHTKVALRNYLRDMGWSYKRIEQSFQEITRIVNNAD